MSTWSDRSLRCAACGGSVAARIALGAHVGRAPHVRDAVLARRFHVFPCDCGFTIRADVTFEYTDIERRQLFYVGRTDQIAHWPELEDQLRGLVLRVLELGSPLTQGFVHDVAGRVVFGLEELREKLVLADAAISDGIAECIKVRAFASEPTLAVPGARLHVTEVTGGDELVCWWFPRAGEAPARQLELPATWTRDALRDRASLEARFPELFRSGFVSVDRFREHVLG